MSYMLYIFLIYSYIFVHAALIFDGQFLKFSFIFAVYMSILLIWMLLCHCFLLLVCWWYYALMYTFVVGKLAVFECAMLLSNEQNYIHNHLKRSNYPHVTDTNYTILIIKLLVMITHPYNQALSLSHWSILRSPWGVSQPSQKITTATKASRSFFFFVVADVSNFLTHINLLV